MPQSEYFARKISRSGEDKLPNVREYCAKQDDPFPFSSKPSGSKGELPHLEWLRVRFIWDCDADSLFTKKSSLEQSGTIVRFLRDSLDLDWERVTEGRHSAGSLYARLRGLASNVSSTTVYGSEPMLDSSSPTGSQHSDEFFMTYRTHGLHPNTTISAHPTSEISPSVWKTKMSPSAAELGHHHPAHGSAQASSIHLPSLARDEDGDTMSESSLSDEDSAYEPTSSPPGAIMEEIDGSNPENRLEKEVEYAATAFLYVMMDAFESTDADITRDEAKEQDLKLDYT